MGGKPLSSKTILDCDTSKFMFSKTILDCDTSKFMLMHWKCFASSKQSSSKGYDCDISTKKKKKISTRHLSLEVRNYYDFFLSELVIWSCQL